MRRSITFALTLLGLFDSLYLLWVYASPAHAMVCLGSGCDEVRASRFAHLAGIPTPLFGVVMYTVLALLLLAEPVVAPGGAALLRRATVGIAGAGVAASAVLTAIEAFVIHAWCAWCVVQAIAVTLILVLSTTLLRSRFDDRAQARKVLWRHVLVLVLAIAAGAHAFVWLQAHAALPAQTAASQPPPTALDLAQRLVRPDSHVSGNPSALVTLVEFGDIQCPSCVAAESEMLQLRARYGNRVRFVFRQFPLAQVHQYALRAAEASECAAQQGKFWEALERFYRANGELGNTSLERYAAEIGLDGDKFHSCLASEATLAIIRRDIDDGHALGVRGTPTFFLGGQRIVGAPAMSDFEQLLNRELAVVAPAESSPSAPAVPAPRTPRPKQQAAKPGAPAINAAASSSSNPFLNIGAGSADCTEDAPKGPEPAMIHTAEAEKLFHGGSVFVDVRSPDDFRQSRIQGAVNVPLLEAQRRVTELPRDKTIVLYEGGSGGSNDVCAASRAVGRVLLGHGYKNVVVYQDGLSGWQQQSLPTAR